MTTPRTTTRRTALTAATLSALVATAGCVTIGSPRREANPEKYNAYERLNVDGTITIDLRGPTHPTLDEVGISEAARRADPNITSLSISHHPAFPIRLLLPTGEATLTTKGSMMTTLGAGRGTGIPADVDIYNSLTPEDLLAVIDEHGPVLGLSRRQVATAASNSVTGEGLASGYSRTTLVGYQDDDLLVELTTLPPAPDSDTVGLVWSFSVHQSVHRDSRSASTAPAPAAP